MLRFLFLVVLGISACAAFPDSKGSNSTLATSTKAPEKTSTLPTVNSTSNSGNSTVQVTIYVSNLHSFLGVPWTMGVSGCVPVPKLLYKKTSAIDTHGNCLILYGRENCEGQQIEIPQGQSYFSLGSLNFDDILASLEPCKDLNTTEHPLVIPLVIPSAKVEKQAPVVHALDRRHKRSESTPKPPSTVHTVQKAAAVEKPTMEPSDEWNPEIPTLSFSDLGIKDKRQLNGSVQLTHVIY